MVLGDWRALLERLPAETPVIFCNRSGQPLKPESFCDGRQPVLGQEWVGRQGWCACVIVELDDPL